MKSYKEMVENVLKRRDAYVVTQKKRKRIFYYAVTSICVVLVISIGLLLPSNPQEGLPLPPSDSSFQVPSYGNSSIHSQNVSSTPIGTVSSSANPSVISPSSANTSIIAPFGPSIPSVPSSNTSTNPPLSPSTPSDNQQSTESSKPEIPSQDTPSTPTIQYKYDFNSLEELEVYLPKLHINITAPPDSTIYEIPVITTPPPDENFWTTDQNEPTNSESNYDDVIGTDVIVGAPENNFYPDADVPGSNYYPEAGTPAEPVVPSDKEIWDIAKNMFDDGYYSVPYLQQGNELLKLQQIFVNEDTVIYHYRFSSQVPDVSSSHYLNVQLYNYSIESTYERYIGENKHLIFTYNDVTYTAFQLENNMYDACVIWQQNGMWCRANYVGPDQYLACIIPNLYLVQISWNQ